MRDSDDRRRNEPSLVLCEAVPVISRHELFGVVVRENQERRRCRTTYGEFCDLAGFLHSLKRSE